MLHGLGYWKKNSVSFISYGKWSLQGGLEHVHAESKSPMYVIWYDYKTCLWEECPTEYV